MKFIKFVHILREVNFNNGIPIKFNFPDLNFSVLYSGDNFFSLKYDAVSPA